MTDHDDRQTIAAALNTVDGISCEPYYRQTARAGDAFVSWSGLTPSENGFGYMNRWEVLIVLPADIAMAERAMSDNLGAWLDALEAAIVVTGAEPAQLNIDAGMVPAVTITGARARN